jgi:hypothetical protein
VTDAQASPTPRSTVRNLGCTSVGAALHVLLTAALDGDSLELLHRYQHKLRIDHKLVRRYAVKFGAALSEDVASPETYGSLAQAFALHAEREPDGDETSRARKLRYTNSAFNCIDTLKASNSDVARLLARLDALTEKVSR